MSKKISKESKLFSDISQLIVDARSRTAVVVNTELSLLYWHIGKLLNDEILLNNKPEYGKQIIATLSKHLTQEFGRGWSQRQLFYCLKTAEVFPDKNILHTLCAKLSWSHLRLLINIEDPLKRDFYIELCKLEHWSSRQLQDRIRSMLYERTALSKKPEETIKHDLQLLRDEEKLSPDLVFRDPYLLDFLGLSHTHSEKILKPQSWQNYNTLL
jgi:hypothetical protein